jgi:hypothetical protein
LSMLIWNRKVILILNIYIVEIQRLKHWNGT